jgi:hypothetical protein
MTRSLVFTRGLMMAGERHIAGADKIRTILRREEQG